MAVTYDQAGIDYDQAGYTYNGAAAGAVASVHATSKPVVGGVRSRPVAYAVSGGRYPTLLSESGDKLVAETDDDLLMETVFYG